MSAVEVGLLARRLTSGSYAHAAALTIARDPRASDLAPLPRQPGWQPEGLVLRKDGTSLTYDWTHCLEAARADPVLVDDLDRAWLASALIVLGDRLAIEGYFDRAPILEMVRHLRNGVGHGNRFEIRDPQQLARWPAHTRHAAIVSTAGTTFEITPDLHGTPVLFHFMGPGDVIDVLIGVGTHLLGQ